MIDYQKSYLGKNLNSLSQLGNTLCDGGVDISISARIGYNCRYKATPYWLKLKNRIDNTFELLDEVNHCDTALDRDRGEDYKLGGTAKNLRGLKLIVYTATFILRGIFKLKKLKNKWI